MTDDGKNGDEVVRMACTQELSLCHAVHESNTNIRMVSPEKVSQGQKNGQEMLESSKLKMFSRADQTAKLIASWFAETRLEMKPPTRTLNLHRGKKQGGSVSFQTDFGGPEAAEGTDGIFIGGIKLEEARTQPLLTPAKLPEARENRAAFVVPRLSSSIRMTRHLLNLLTQNG